MIRPTILIVALILSLSQPASAVTLMVNGETPSSRWQEYVNKEFRVPTYPGTVNLYLETCPDFIPPRGCYFKHSMWVPERDTWGFSQTLRHELGHAMNELLDEGDRAYFVRLWGLRADRWYASYEEAEAWKDSWLYFTIPAERFAETYSLCSSYRLIRAFTIRWLDRFLGPLTPRDAAHKTNRTCALIKQVAAGRHKAG